MAEKKANMIVIMSAVTGCIATLITCGVVMGRVQGSVEHNKTELETMCTQVEGIKVDVSAIKEEQAFQKGVVTTQLQTHGTALVRIEKKLDDLVRAD